MHSPLLPHNKSATTGGNTDSGEIDFNRTTMAIPTMVSSAFIDGSVSTLTSSQVTLSAKKSCRRDSPIIEKLLSKSSGLASFRNRLSETGVPESACKLILNSRRTGTLENYDSTWNKWVLWCNGRGVDPFTCPLNEVLGYLASLYDDNYQYRTIGVHRSAISCYHSPIEGFSVGKHPKVSHLMSGVFNLRPPQPRYGFTWDVEIVLSLFKSWPYILSPKQLTIKTTTLLGLIAISRGAEIHQLDMKFLSKFSDHYRFYLAGTVKNKREGKKPEPLNFFST